MTHISAKLSFLERAHSIPEIAEFLGCTPKFIFDEVVRGRLRVRKISIRMTRIFPEDLLAWMALGPPTEHPYRAYRAKLKAVTEAAAKVGQLQEV